MGRRYIDYKMPTLINPTAQEEFDKYSHINNHQKVFKIIFVL